MQERHWRTITPAGSRQQSCCRVPVLQPSTYRKRVEMTSSSVRILSCRPSASETGYILEPASSRGNETPERELSQQTTAIIRILMHSCLIWASCSQASLNTNKPFDQHLMTFPVFQASDKALQHLVRSRLGRVSMTEFVWSQMLHDFNQLSRTMPFGGQEDVFIVMHILNRHITTLADRQCKYFAFLTNRSIHRQFCPYSWFARPSFDVESRKN